MVSSVHVEPVSRSDQYKRVMKPLLERKRRARINRCLDELRDLLVSVLQNEGEAVTRLEKADILELTVRHVRRLSQYRRLALPSASATMQQDREDVVKFQQGFVAAAHQVQNFLMNTPLEPSVSTKLLSHLTNYATSITPPPQPSPPSSSTTSNPPNIPPTSQAHPVGPPPALPSQLQSPHQANSPPPPLSVYQPPQPNCQLSVSTVQTIHPPQVQSPVQIKSTSCSPTSAAPINKQPQPLVDLSNHQNKFIPPHPPLQPDSSTCSPPPVQSSSYNNSLPIIRDVRPEDRVVAPSPFIDVVSTAESEDFKPATIMIPKRSFVTKPNASTPQNNPPISSRSVGLRQFHLTQSTVRHAMPPPPMFDDVKKEPGLHVQPKIVPSQLAVPRVTPVRHQPYPLPTPHLPPPAPPYQSLQPQARPSPPPSQHRSSPGPQDLSMKKPCVDELGNSWRPW